MSEMVRATAYVPPQFPAGTTRARSDAAADKGFGDTLDRLDSRDKRAPAADDHHAPERTHGASGTRTAHADESDAPDDDPRDDASESSQDDTDSLAQLLGLRNQAAGGKPDAAEDKDGMPDGTKAATQDGKDAATPAALPQPVMETAKPVSGEARPAPQDQVAAQPAAAAVLAIGNNGKKSAPSRDSPPPAGTGNPDAKTPAAIATPDGIAQGKGKNGPQTPVIPVQKGPDASDKPNLGDAGAKLKVVSIHTTPAPAAQPPTPGPTIPALVDAISSGASSAQGSQPPALPAHNAAPPAPVLHTMKIQLYPAALGMVTAKLRLVGDSLNVDLQVNTIEAHHRLSSDSDAIVKSLRALGYDVDRVTVQPPPAQAATTGNHNAASTGRDQAFSQGWKSGNGGDGSGGASGGRHQQGEAPSHHGGSQKDQTNPRGGGLFI